MLKKYLFVSSVVLGFSGQVDCADQVAKFSIDGQLVEITMPKKRKSENESAEKGSEESDFKIKRRTIEEPGDALAMEYLIRRLSVWKNQLLTHGLARASANVGGLQGLEIQFYRIRDDIYDYCYKNFKYKSSWEQVRAYNDDFLDTYLWVDTCARANLEYRRLYPGYENFSFPA